MTRPDEKRDLEIIQKMRAGADLPRRHLRVWRDLEAARGGASDYGAVSGAGGNVVEIYAYCLLSDDLGASPLFLEIPLATQARIAAGELTRILRRFCTLYPDCEIWVEQTAAPSGQRRFKVIDVGREDVAPFAHRIRLSIFQRPPATPGQTWRASGRASGARAGEAVPWWRAAWRRLHDGWAP